MPLSITDLVQMLKAPPAMQQPLSPEMGPVIRQGGTFGQPIIREGEPMAPVGSGGPPMGQTIGDVIQGPWGQQSLEQGVPIVPGTGQPGGMAPPPPGGNVVRMPPSQREQEFFKGTALDPNFRPSSFADQVKPAEIIARPTGAPGTVGGTMSPPPPNLGMGDLRANLDAIRRITGGKNSQSTMNEMMAKEGVKPTGPTANDSAQTSFPIPSIGPKLNLTDQSQVNAMLKAGRTPSEIAAYLKSQPPRQEPEGSWRDNPSINNPETLDMARMLKGGVDPSMINKMVPMDQRGAQLEQLRPDVIKQQAADMQTLRWAQGQGMNIEKIEQALPILRQKFGPEAIKHWLAVQHQKGLI